VRKWIIVGVAAALVVGGLSGRGDDEDVALSSDEAATPTASGSVAARPPADEADLIVTKIVDGDTIQLSDGRKVRVLGIDAPDMGECGYEEAREFARATLLDEKVTVAVDSTQDSVDQYGRSLLYVGRWGVDYSHAIVVAGLATATISATNPVEKATTLQAAEDTARALELGIWGDPCTPTPAPTTTRTSQPRLFDTNDDVAADVPNRPVPTHAPAPRTTPPRSQSPRPEPPREPAPAPAPRPSGCHPSYEPCVPDSSRDLDCGDIGYEVKVLGHDEYRLDGDDNDGKGCERYPSN
jgi:endonuclease YncB( thermonuclease family)